jgi:GT2 family glycosyltransferase
MIAERTQSAPAEAVDITPAVTVVIVTRNRPALLRRTLATLRASALRDMPVIVMDDASDEPLVLDGVDLDLRLLRNATREGYVTSRTRANLAAGTPFVLSLDDDSWPRSGDFLSALEYLRSCDDVLALTFPISAPGDRWQVASLADAPYAVKGFVGCAHLLHVGHFQDLGGYSSAMVHQGEELEIAARGFARGLRVVHFPGFVVHHEYTSVGRDVNRMLFHGARNKARFLRAFCPRGRLAWYLLRALAEAVIFSVVHRRISPSRGWWRGVRERLISDASRRFDASRWREWRSLPYA